MFLVSAKNNIAYGRKFRKNVTTSTGKKLEP